MVAIDFRNSVSPLLEEIKIDFNEFGYCLCITDTKESGASSFRYLQNVYTSADVTRQNLSVALAVSDSVLKENGVARVHGGGFAGTIQAFVKNDYVEEYRNRMDAVFGTGACKILKIRKEGGVKII